LIILIRHDTVLFINMHLILYIIRNYKELGSHLYVLVHPEVGQ
jgi:hypothetical protein